MTWTLIIVCFVNSIVQLGYGIYKKAKGFGAISILLGMATIIVAIIATANLIFG